MNVKKLRIVPNPSSIARSFVPKTSSRARCFLNFPLGSKKAMSPLFSTIILIGFAIALGGIVMSWGREGYTAEKEMEQIGCGETSLSLVSYGENKGICSKDSRLYFTVLNDGDVSLDGIKVSVLGDKEIFSSVIDKQLNVADIVKLELEYGDIGKIEKVIFIPRFAYPETGKLCPKNGFSIEKIGEC